MDDQANKDLETFDDLRLAAFNSNYLLKMDFEKFPARQPMQEKGILSTTAPLKDGLEMVSQRKCNRNIATSKPEDLTDPCTCGKCVHKRQQWICRCRVAGIKCCKYCKCKGGESCKNPITE